MRNGPHKLWREAGGIDNVGSRMNLIVRTTEGRPRLSNQVADWITYDILEGKLVPGTMIGMEPELMQRYGVSRATLREAVRQVEARGVARMRRGAGGGLISVGTPISIAATTLATYFEFSSVTLAELMRARAELEAMAAGMAARRVGEGEIAILRVAAVSLRGVTDPIEARDRHFALRGLIARMSGNAMVEIATVAFQLVTRDLSALLSRDPVTVQRYIADQREQKHSLVEAIAAGDAAGATVMVRQEGEGLLGARNLAPYLDFALPDLVLELGEAPSTHRLSDDKLGITTALKMRRDIVVDSGARGEIIGTEEQLRLRYGVSRGLLREALMLLELNGVVHIQRGRIGGIAVGQPDPAATIATIAAQMKLMDFADVDLRNIVATIDTYAVGAVAGSIEPAKVFSLGEDPVCVPSYAAMIEALYPPAQKRSAELICDIIRAYKPELASPLYAGEGRHSQWHGLREALLKRDRALVQRNMRGLWGRLDL